MYNIICNFSLEQQMQGEKPLLLSIFHQSSSTHDYINWSLANMMIHTLPLSSDSDLWVTFPEIPKEQRYFCGVSLEDDREFIKSSDESKSY